MADTDYVSRIKPTLTIDDSFGEFQAAYMTWDPADEGEKHGPYVLHRNAAYHFEKRHHESFSKDRGPLVLFSYKEQVVSFAYRGGAMWTDPAHRGKGLARILLKELISVYGGLEAYFTDKEGNPRMPSLTEGGAATLRAAVKEWQDGGGT